MVDNIKNGSYNPYTQTIPMYNSSYSSSPQSTMMDINMKLNKIINDKFWTECYGNHTLKQLSDYGCDNLGYTKLLHKIY